MKELDNYYKAVEDITREFAKKYFDGVYVYHKEDWVAGDIGSVICINDYWFSLDHIIVSLKDSATLDEILEYQDTIMERASKMNFEHWLKFYRSNNELP